MAGNQAQAIQDGGSFSERMRGTEPRAEDVQFPGLVQDLYDVADARRAGQPFPPPDDVPAGWSRIPDDELRATGIDPALLRSDRNGFDAGFYRGEHGQVVLVMAGTNEGQDWKHNFRQGLGLTSDQYEQAFEVARKARAAYGDDLVLTGHSLGGGLAAASAMITDTPAVTYNASGVHDRTLEREGVDPAAAKEYAGEGLVRTYKVRNEVLTHLQEDAFLINRLMPDAPGHAIQLPDPDPLSFGQRLIPGKMLMHRVDLHYIEAVIDAQRAAGLHERFGDPARESAVQGAAAQPPALPGLEISPERQAQWDARVQAHRQALDQPSPQQAQEQDTAFAR
ncbi:Mbeg1-like protein [Luteimonas huabeiensis]|uniref:Mbeg1-like protein n=1 Tax=Luteimonas huabeiensis TaxID=1244513 RepID=UPI0004655329|nr:Mbeg1-like protein [Luteimonas huabeiensis]